ncbi:periplasmic nitrate reductase chaperone NapD [Halospina denitrificans]|uniref:Chaperone NapD n=1 Tax=Halospina denitrificans TaxID=332522 RepID=A0A4R7JZZ3_9GAMM|nr:chaperone NapD [Halospina denitrificans]TDT43143.1 periplasmic nitrate reductase chaperone NapD [Halospina denitrificans]
MDDPIHIASLLVQVQPDRLVSVRDWLAAQSGAEIRGEDAAGKLVVVLESSGERAILDLIEATEVREGTLSANLVYHEIINAEDAEQHEEVQP